MGRVISRTYVASRKRRDKWSRRFADRDMLWSHVRVFAHFCLNLDKGKERKGSKVSQIYTITWLLCAFSLVVDRDLLEDKHTMASNPRQITSADLFFFFHAHQILQQTIWSCDVICDLVGGQTRHKHAQAKTCDDLRSRLIRALQYLRTWKCNLLVK